MAVEWKKLAYASEVDYGLSFEAVVTTYTDTTHFKASGLIGKGNDFFVGYYAFVVWDAGGAGAAPQGEMSLISDYTSADGTFTHAAFSAILAVTDKLLILNPRLLDSFNTLDGVYVDSANGIAGTSFPVGTAGIPSNTLANGFTIAAARGLTKIYLGAGDYTLPSTPAGYHIIGRWGGGAGVITDLDLNSQILGECLIERCGISGSSGTTGDIPRFVQCSFYHAIGGAEYVYNADIYDSLIDYIGIYGQVWLYNCYGEFSTMYLDNAEDTQITNYKGLLVLRNLINSNNVYVRGSDVGFTLGIATTCTDGDINVHGDVNIIDYGHSCTLKDYRQNPVSTRFFQETVVATDVNGTTWKDLLDKSVITNRYQICGFKVTIGGTWAGDLKIRIVDENDVKIFPFQDEYVEGTDFTNGVQATFNFPVNVQAYKGYQFQFRSSDAGDGVGETLALNNLDVIELS